MYSLSIYIIGKRFAWRFENIAFFLKKNKISEEGYRILGIAFFCKLWYNKIMRSVGIAYLLWLCSGCGALGFHRFYLGKIGTGLLWMMSGGLGMIGSIYDFFTLPRQVREVNARNVGMYVSGDPQPYINEVHYYAEPPKEREKPEHTILRLAKQNKGLVSAADLALESNMTIEQAKAELEAMVKKGFAELRVKKTGALVYTIPEYLENTGGLEDF
jgi:TM2 domain-containing membrane protein YozV